MQSEDGRAKGSDWRRSRDREGTLTGHILFEGARMGGQCEQYSTSDSERLVSSEVRRGERLAAWCSST